MALKLGGGTGLQIGLCDFPYSGLNVVFLSVNLYTS